VTEIGPVNFTTSLGMGSSWLNGDPIFWQSPGTYYVSMVIHYLNGSESTPYTLETKPVYVAPASHGLSPLDIVVYVVFTVGVGIATYFGLYLQIREGRKRPYQVRTPREGRHREMRSKP
jgi:hypothetical protein